MRWLVYPSVAALLGGLMVPAGAALAMDPYSALAYGAAAGTMSKEMSGSQNQLFAQTGDGKSDAELGQRFGRFMNSFMEGVSDRGTADSEPQRSDHGRYGDRYRQEDDRHQRPSADRERAQRRTPQYLYDPWGAQRWSGPVDYDPLGSAYRGGGGYGDGYSPYGGVGYGGYPGAGSGVPMGVYGDELSSPPYRYEGAEERSYPPSFYTVDPDEWHPGSRPYGSYGNWGPWGSNPWGW